MFELEGLRIAVAIVILALVLWLPEFKETKVRIKIRPLKRTPERTWIEIRESRSQ